MCDGREHLQKRAERLLLHLTTPESVTAAEWAATKETIRREIWQAAPAVAHHGDVAKAVGMPPVGSRWYGALDEACLEVVAVGAPLVTSLVTSRGSDLPGEGFLRLAERLCLDWDDAEQFKRTEQGLSRRWIEEHAQGWRLSS